MMIKLLPINILSETLLFKPMGELSAFESAIWLFQSTISRPTFSLRVLFA
jgi:hypothetical protein